MQDGLLPGLLDVDDVLRIDTRAPLNAHSGRVDAASLQVGSPTPNTALGFHGAGGKAVNVNPIPKHASLAFPGTFGNVVNLAVGRFNLHGQGPFSSIIHAAPDMLVTASVSSTITGMETIPVAVNVQGVAANLPAVGSYVSGGVFTANAATITGGDHIEYSAGTVIQGTNSGALTVTNKTGFKAAGTVSSGATATTVRGFHAVEQGNGGTITTNIGIDVEMLTGGSTNYGARLGSNPTTITAAVTGAALGIFTDGLTVDFTNASIPAAVSVPGTFTLNQSAFAFGMGSLFVNNATFKNANGVVANMAPFYTLLSTPTFEADGASINTGFQYGILVGPTFSVINAGTISGGTAVNFNSAATVNTGCTIDTVTHYLVNNAGGSGTVTTQYGIDIPVLSKGGTNVGIRNKSTLRQTAAITLGADAAATWLLHLQGGNSATAAFGLNVSTTGPTAPSSNATGVISVYKGATNYYLLVTFNDGGTTRYRYMQLNGTTATWTQGTSLPT